MPAHRPAQLALATASAALLAATGAATAGAANVTVTGDDGNPLPLSPTATATIRTIAPVVDVAQPPGAGRYAVTVTDPAGNAAAAPTACEEPTRATRTGFPYRGNGVYTVSVTSYLPTDLTCQTPIGPPEGFRFKVDDGVVVHRRSPFVLRAPGSTRPAPLALPVALAPGADRHEVRFARNGKVGRDGAIRGRSQAGDVNVAARAATLTFTRPGVYTVVARGLRNGIGTPWSKPVTIRVLAPFDLRSHRWTDRTGPRFGLVAQVRERSARGRVTVALARGRGPFRTLGRATISRSATFAASFTAARAGRYRLRFTYGGSRTVARGTALVTLRVGTAIVS
jgi:hypothetical protein